MIGGLRPVFISYSFIPLIFFPLCNINSALANWTKAMLTTGSCSSHACFWLCIVTPHHCLFCLLLITIFWLGRKKKNSRNNSLLGSKMHAVLSYLFKGLTSKVTDCFVKQMCEFCVGVDMPIWSRAVNIIAQGLVQDMLLERRSTGFFSSENFTPPPLVSLESNFLCQTFFFSCKLYNRTQLVVYPHICWYSVVYKLLHKNMPNGQKIQHEQNYQIRLADAYIKHVCLHCV